MEIAAVLALVAKGISVATALFEAGQTALPALEAVGKLVTGAQGGAVTPEQLADTEALLDAQIDEFDLEIE